ncbi:thiamine pyrophosphate-binding protein [Lewinella cohaerens]|uniref:thiamine pyrophosphate-binding protein n=1 Tax=Lewinella cohaerens TaxID=70995 RepID=UPI0003800FCE|nr:thiamine pyrophosphate-binding protein [Lewinella cohaerens]
MQLLKTATADTVANYLKTRLVQLGVQDLFGVAGNYAAPFLDTVLADPAQYIQLLGTTTEMNAGYAADAYARYHGYGGAFVTYGVGSFSILNATAGSFVEKVPVLVINGAPTNKEDNIEKNAGLLFSHSTGNKFADIEMFRKVTIAAERITNANLAPFQIDKVITAMIAYQQPGYIEVAEDVWRSPCPPPKGRLKVNPALTTSVSEVKAAVDAAMEVISCFPKVVAWAGIELRQQKLTAEFEQLLEQLNKLVPKDEAAIQFVTSFMSKSVMAEDHPRFDSCRVIEKNLTSEVIPDYCLLGIGGWTVDANVASQNIRDERLILACNGGVLVGAEFFPTVALPDFIDELTQRLRHQNGLSLKGAVLKPLPVPNLGKALTFDTFFHALQQGWKPEYILLSGVGFTLSIASYLRGVAQNGYLTDGVWLSIGYPVGAATGVAQACKRAAATKGQDKRTFVVIGDGAFQEVCQAVSDHNYHQQNNVIFVLSNTIYGIEQFLVNPNPFREKPTDYEPPNQILNTVYSYNDLHQWDYVKLAESFGSIGIKVSTLEEMEHAMCMIEDHLDRNFLIEIVVPKTDIPADLLAVTPYVGEDETANANWPPASKF